MSDPVIEALRRAVEAAPDDAALRVHLGRLLLEHGEPDAALAEAAAVLQRFPADADARRLMADVLAPAPAQPDAAQPAAPVAPAAPPEPTGFDWPAAEEQVRDLAGPRFVAGEREPAYAEAAPEPDPGADLERPSLTLDDVGGMREVKDRLNAAFLAPLTNPELRALYGKSLKGGLLMYGPPGCGKTFLARALAGELGAAFLSIGITDVLAQWLGQAEQNLHEAFQAARRSAPCVVFLDELDTLGQRRSLTRGTALRGVVNQLLTELDGVESSNEGVFVLAATNQPWDVDPALRRPGRFDRTLLVLPPDAPAREAIFRHHLQHRPIEGVDLGRLAAASDGLSGADIAAVCEQAAEAALLDSVRSGHARLIGMPDLEAALRVTRPSTTAWLDAVRNLVAYGDDDGTFTELRAYLKRTKRL